METLYAVNKSELTAAIPIKGLAIPIDTGVRITMDERIKEETKGRIIDLCIEQGHPPSLQFVQARP